MSWFKKADPFPSMPPKGLPSAPPMSGAKPPFGGSPEKGEVETASKVAKDLKALIAKEKGESKDVKPLEDALSKVEKYIEDEKKEKEKSSKDEKKEKKDEKKEVPEKKEEASY